MEFLRSYIIRFIICKPKVLSTNTQLIFLGLGTRKLFLETRDEQKVGQLKDQIEAGYKKSEALIYSGKTDYSSVETHVLASVIKLFFTQLPEPLIPATHFSNFAHWLGSCCLE